MKLNKIRGWGTSKVKELETKGITCVEELLTIPPPQYAEMTGIDNDTAQSHFRLAREAYNMEHKITDWKTLSSEIENHEDIDKISTGSTALDKLFMGGVECKATTEVYGEFGCGKTQFAHTIIVRSQLPKSKGGLECKGIWINTENTFEKSRIRQIAEPLGLDSDKVLENIVVANAYNSTDQMDILHNAEKLIVEDPTYRILIVDSATGLFRQDYSGLGMLSERQKYLDRFLTRCSNMAKVHNIAVVWTNQIYTAPTFFGDGKTPVGGSKIAHKSTYRVDFSKSGKYRIAKMVDSPKDAQTEVMFGLSSLGVVDMDVAKKEEDERKKELTAMKKAGKAGKMLGEEDNEEPKQEEEITQI